MTKQKITQHSKDIPSSTALKIIHFIWAGGLKLMPSEISIPNVKAWLKKNPDFKVWLWVDIKTARGPSYADRKKYLLKSYQERFEAHVVTFDESSIPENNTLPVIVLKDIEDEKIANPYIRHSIDRFDPNFGISSDLLRYKILYYFGGAYFDSDVKPGSARLNTLKIYAKPENKHYLHYVYVDHLTQLPNPKLSDLKKFEVRGIVGNDAFVCSKHNPIMQALYLGAEKEFADIKFNEEQVVIRCYGASSFVTDTIAMTGPRHVQDFLSKCEYKRIHESKGSRTIGYRTRVNNQAVEIRPLRNDKRQVCQPEQDNTRDWINAPLCKIRDPKEAERRLEEIIKFELKTFGILRLEDHFELLCKVSRRINPDIAVGILHRILKRNEGLLEEVKIVQYLFTPEITSVIKSFKLEGKTRHDHKMVESCVLGTAFLFLVNRGLISDIKSRKPLEKRFRSHYVHKLLSFFQKGVKYIRGRLPNISTIEKVETYVQALARFEETMTRLAKLGYANDVRRFSMTLRSEELRETLAHKAKALENDQPLSNNPESSPEDEPEPSELGPPTL